MKTNIRKLAMAGVLVALSVVCSTFYIPIGASKCFPIQHFVNVLVAVVLGPFYGVAMAFCTSFLRVVLGTGSLLAFPGSMIGALLCGVIYDKTHNLIATYFGEAIGTGVIGAMIAYPVATLVMGKEAALFTYVIPFLISSGIGAAFSVVFLGVLSKAKILSKVQSEIL